MLVGPGARHELSTVVPGRSTRAAIVTQPGVGVEVDAGVEQRTFLIGEGEKAKSMSTVEELCSGFAEFGLTRADVVVGVGGGVVTDVAGFAAAVYHRGVAVAHVATTLLAQVDAAIGGKTGVNLPEGKNLVGAFWQPSAVICDTEVLSSLPPREYGSGLGEMAKYAFLGVPGLPEMGLEEAVAACVECKARVVAGDERETGVLVGPAGPASPVGRRRTWASAPWAPCRLNPGPQAYEGRVMSPATQGGRCSTTATLWPTRSRHQATTTCATARRLPLAWCSLPVWPVSSAGSTTSG